MKDIRILSRSLAGTAAFALAAACSGNAAPDPAPGMPSPDPDPAPPTGAAAVTLQTSTAAPGTSLEIRADGFPASTQVDIGFGRPSSEYSVVREVSTDAQGSLRTSITVPEWAERGDPYVIVVAAPGNDPRVTSDPFVAAAPGDSVSVHGTLSDEGVECRALRGPLGTLYTLAGDVEYDVGTQVRVEGTIAGPSICMQGTTINVERIVSR